MGFVSGELYWRPRELAYLWWFITPCQLLKPKLVPVLYICTLSVSVINLFFFFRQLVSLKMLNTLPQVSISVTLYWFSLMNKHIWRRKNNWNRYKRTPRRFVRRFDPLFYPKNKNGNGFLILTVSYHERFPFWNFQKSKGEG